MTNFIKQLILLYFLLFSVMLYSQNNNKDYSAEIVTLKNQNLENFIDSIDLKNHYLREGQIWYIDFRNKDKIKLASSRISKLIQLHSELFITIINNNIIFLVTEEDYMINIKKTGLWVDLKRFNILDLTFELSSYWILKEIDGKIKIIKESIYDGK